MKIQFLVKISAYLNIRCLTKLLDQKKISEIVKTPAAFFNRLPEWEIAGTENQLFGIVRMYKNWKFTFEFFPKSTELNKFPEFLHFRPEAPIDDWTILGFWLKPNSTEIRIHYFMNSENLHFDLPEIPLNSWSQFEANQFGTENGYTLSIKMNNILHFEVQNETPFDYEKINLYSARVSGKNFHEILVSEFGSNFKIIFG